MRAPGIGSEVSSGCRHQSQPKPATRLKLMITPMIDPTMS